MRVKLPKISEEDLRDIENISLESLPVELRVSKPFHLTDRLIRLSHLKRILTGLGKWDKQTEDRLEKFKETGL